MDLELTIPPARGKRPAATECGYLRDLNDEDIVLLQAGYTLNSQTPAIKKLRTAHHELARLLASGVRPVEASAITGYSQSRISILCNDPAFKNLLSFYNDERKDVNIEVMKRIRSVGLDAIEEIKDRLEESPEDFTNEELRKLAETALDRSGFGPKSTVTHERTVDPSILAALKEAVNKEEKNNVIEIEDYQESPVGGSDGGAALLREESQIELFPEEGPGVSTPIRALVAQTSGGEGT